MDGDNLTKEQLVEELDSSFLKVALEDMKRAIHPEVNTNLAVFILGVCLIDALAGFYGGKEEATSKGNCDRFKNFVKKYLPQYNSDDLYEARNGLLHSYVVENIVLLIRNRTCIINQLMEGKL